MAEKTGISWTKSTFNPWIGCTKVGPGCDACYAEALDGRHKWGGKTHWGVGTPRMRTSESYWLQPLKWEKMAKETGEFWPVFCCSLADVFDNEVPQEWRDDLWNLIENTPHLTWQLVTKRVSNVMKMIPENWRAQLPKNVWIVATMVNQDEFDRDWPKLRAIPARVRGLSVEPMLGNIQFPDITRSLGYKSELENVRGELHWVIYGGESKQGFHMPRECRLTWLNDGIAQCRELGIAPFIKQAGHAITTATMTSEGILHHLPAWAVGKNADPTRWPKWMQVQEFPRA